MNKINRLLLCSSLAVVAFGAQAGMSGKDSARITNGGTGYIGLTESAGMSRSAFDARTTVATSGIPTQAGEASTFVNGRPNQQPATLQGAATDARMMGAGSMAAPIRPAHPGWGTPD